MNDPTPDRAVIVHVLVHFMFFMINEIYNGFCALTSGLVNDSLISHSSINNRSINVRSIRDSTISDTNNNNISSHNSSSHNNSSNNNSSVSDSSITDRSINATWISDRSNNASWISDSSIYSRNSQMLPVHPEISHFYRKRKILINVHGTINASIHNKTEIFRQTSSFE
ncbi:hypothetical protein HA402_009284 [Bradysia odoriphaga]|nr:hypothetical protein HA402_009284 [Bradysia odoriphaga]